MGGYSNLFVCLMGICTVFIGLACIIALVSVMSAIVQRTNGQRSPTQDTHQQSSSIQNQHPTPELVAAIAVAIAEASGTEPEALRILSIRKI